eukprot:gene12242-biopygen10302
MGSPGKEGRNIACMAEGVGISLAAYDTDEARRSLEGLSGGDADVALPSKLHGALLQLVANLELYKPYSLAGLPTSGNRNCFEGSRIAGQREVHPRYRFLFRGCGRWEFSRTNTYDYFG